MKIITANYILTCNAKFEIIKDGAVCFDQKIIAVGKKEEILTRFKECEIIEGGKNSVLMPGLINPHVHLEFSGNLTTLEYGSFIKWLESVISKREELLQKCSTACMQKSIDDMLKSGITAYGAISSFGKDLEVCVNSPQKVIFFNEILGSSPTTVDVMFDEFKSRLKRSLEFRSKTFQPAISIHAPYSTHPILAKNALDIAKKYSFVVSTHFMESMAERNWLDGGKGEFNDFFSSFNPNSKPLTSALEYLELFRGAYTLFVHSTCANKEVLFIISKLGALCHCPVSNRLLNNPPLSLKEVEFSNCLLTIGTDGLSSNVSLSLWDELRNALMIHNKTQPNLLSKKLILSVTKNASFALGLNSGEIKTDKDADMILLELPDHINDTASLPLHLILHTQNAQKIFIEGEVVSF